MKQTRVHVLVVAAAALLVFANSLLNGFAFDDEFLIAGNARVHALHDQAAIWLSPYWPVFGAEAGLYRPLAVFAWAVQWAIGAGAAWVFHLGNVLLHVLVSVLLCFLLRVFVTSRAALAGALLFAVHPVHTEAVANVVGQAELIAAAALLAACLLWVTRPLPDETAAGRPARVAGRLAIITLMYAVAMLAKESAIVLPALLVALDAARGRLTPRAQNPGDTGRTRGGLAYIPRSALPLGVLLLTAVAYLALRIEVLGSVTGGNAAPALPFLRTGQRWLVALQAWPEYLRLLAWPFDLSADYSPDVIVPAAGLTPAVLIGGAVLALTLVLAVRTARRPLTGLPAAWFAIAILPVSNLIVPVGVVLAERLLYTPSVAMSIAGAVLYDRAAATGRAYRGVRIAPAVMATLLLLFALRSVVRNPDWKNTAAYWNALIRDHPESYRAQWGVGAHMAANGDPARARTYMERAVETWPHDPELLNELALLHVRYGEPARAIAVLERALPLGAVGHRTALHLAEAYLAAGRAQEALSVSGTLPAEHAALVLRAQALEQLGRFDEAAAAWQQTVPASGHAWTWWAMRARAFARTGDGARAGAAADSTVRQAPDAAARAAADHLARAIEDGCYAPGRTEALCEDPLAGWLLLPAAGVFSARPGPARSAPHTKAPRPDDRRPAHGGAS